jgi:hypothetical protein
MKSDLLHTRTLLMAPLVVLNEHLPEPQMQQITRNLPRVLRILLDQLPRRLLEQLINLFQSFIFGFRHEEDLVEPSEHRNAAVEAERQTSLGHGFLHASEVVCDDERRQEQPCGRGRHAVGAEVGGVDLGGNDPGERGVGSEEQHVENEADEVDAELRTEGVELVADADKHETDEETGQHGDGPETSSAGFHEEDGRDGTEQQGTTTDKRHVGCVVGVESDLRHEDAHVVHDCVDTGELAEEDHDVGVDDGAARTSFGEEVHPWVFVGATSSNLTFLLFGAKLHNKELLAGFVCSNTTDAAPDFVCLERLALVHKVTRALWHEQDTDTHDGGEDERGSENVAPVAGNTDEHGCDRVSENFTESDAELVERNQVTTQSRLDSLGDVDRDGTAFETDTSTEDNAGCDDHTVVHGTGFESTTDGVQDAGDDDSPATTKVFVTRRDEESTGNR